MLLSILVRVKLEVDLVHWNFPRQSCFRKMYTIIEVYAVTRSLIRSPQNLILIAPDCGAHAGCGDRSWEHWIWVFAPNDPPKQTIDGDVRPRDATAEMHMKSKLG